jgi:hypothetical protein
MPEEPGPDAAEAQTWIGWRLDELGGVAVGKGRNAGRAAELSARGGGAITASPAS